MPRIEANGIEIDYAEHGSPSGTPLVLLRGLSTQRTQWPEALLADLARRGFRVVTPDNRDAGLSSAMDEAGLPDVTEAFARAAAGQPIGSPYGISDMASDVAGLLDALGIERAHVVGMSMGGMIAQVFAAEHADRLLAMGSVMSTSGRAGLPGPTPEAAEALLSAPPSSSREDVVAHSLRTIRAFQGSGFGADPAWRRAYFEAAYDRSYRPAGTARQLVAVLASGSRESLLPRIRVPALVIHGDEDGLIPLECGRDTAQLIPRARLEVVKGMGHEVVPSLCPVLADLLEDAFRPRREAKAGQSREPNSGVSS